MKRSTPIMTIDERLEGIALILKLVTRDMQDLKVTVQQDSENIRALARIAECRERRRADLVG
jgi:hypothetical protein